MGIKVLLQWSELSVVFWTPAHLNKSSGNYTRKQETPVGRAEWAVGAGGCISGHRHPTLHLYLAWPWASWIGQIRVLWGKKLSLKPDSQLSEVKKSRLNASAHQIGTSLVCPTPGQCSDQGALRGPPSSSWPASRSGLPWQSVLGICALPWDMLIQLKMLPAEKPLHALPGRQWIGGYWEIFIRISLINLS